jgi:signal transduction histidine kinase
MAPIRVRLTVWYVAILTVSMLVLAGMSWWLSTQSVIRATDTGLAARIDGVRIFLEDPQTVLTVEELRDEFREYVELTRGEALLEVVSPSGVVLCQPAIPGWLTMTRALPPASSSPRVAADRNIAAQPYRVATSTITARGQQYSVTVAAPMGPAYAALRRFHQWLFALLPVVLAFAAAGGYWMSRRALGPVDDMTRAVQTITLQSLDRRLPVPSADDEIRRLAATFNDVLQRLDSAVEEIMRFTADASHELRTPVSLVRTTAELALRHPRSAHEYREALSEIASHAEHMTVLVNDLLALARTDAGLEPERLIPVDARAVLLQTVDDVRARARHVASNDRANVAVPILLLDIPASDVWIDGDPVSLRRLFTILLDNALKYSVEGGRVRVTMTTQPSPGPPAAVVIAIADDGIGLDAAETSRLFERFFRGERARLHAPDGSGLGLAIARTIVSRHRGSIDIGAADEELGRGCCVRVTLTTRQAPALDADPPLAQHGQLPVAL